MSEPLVICDDVFEDYSDHIVLTMMSNDETHCPFEYQVWLVGKVALVKSSSRMQALRQLLSWTT